MSQLALCINPWRMKLLAVCLLAAVAWVACASDSGSASIEAKYTRQCWKSMNKSAKAVLRRVAKCQRRGIPVPQLHIARDYFCEMERETKAADSESKIMMVRGQAHSPSALHSRALARIVATHRSSTIMINGCAWRDASARLMGICPHVAMKYPPCYRRPELCISPLLTFRTLPSKRTKLLMKDTVSTGGR